MKCRRSQGSHTHTHTHTLGLSRYRTGEASETSHGYFTNRMHQSALGNSPCVIVHLFVSESSDCVLVCMSYMHLFMQLRSSAGKSYVVFRRETDWCEIISLNFFVQMRRMCSF